MRHLRCAGSSEVFWGFQLVRIEEWSHLVGQLSQDALSESHTVSLQWQSHPSDSQTHMSSVRRVGASAYLKISERHELDDVSGGNVTSGWSQQFVVTVQELHCAEVCPAHPHDDDGHGQPRGLHNSDACEIHVGDHTICEDEQHVVLLQAGAKKGPFPKSQIQYTGAFFQIKRIIVLHTEAMFCRRACLAKQAAWLMTGAKLVGPQSFSWGRHCR